MLKKIVYFSKLGGTVFVVQLVIQLLGMLVGFIIVRKLSVHEYALYTIANTLLSMMVIISDSGTNTSVYALGAKAWQDKLQLGKVLATGMYLRNRLALISLVITAPILVYLLLKQDATWWEITLISLALIPSFTSSLTTSFYEVIPKLHQDLGVLQKNQVIVAVSRLLLSGLGMILFPFTFIALFANGIPRIIGNFRLRKAISNRLVLTTEIDSEVYNETVRIVKKSAPGAIYYAFSGQVTLWIMSFTGKTANIAEWGALGRYGVLLTLFSTVIGMVLMPRYARSQKDRKGLLIMSHQILLLSAVGGGAIILGIYLFSDFLLQLLGSSYIGLDDELVLISFNSLVTLFVGLCLNFRIRKGWIISPFLDVCLNFFPIVLCAFLMPLGSLWEILQYNLVIQLCYLVGHYVLFLLFVYKNTTLNLPQNE